MKVSASCAPRPRLSQEEINAVFGSSLSSDPLDAARKFLSRATDFDDHKPDGTLVDAATAFALLDIAESLRKIAGRE
jgi:hypothetical protein